MSQTGAYVDLMFAFGHARLGEELAAHELHARGDEQLDSNVANRGVTPRADAVHQYLRQAFRFRIVRALEGLHHGGDWPATLESEFDELSAHSRYIVLQFRSHSAVLEPESRPDPYQGHKAYIDAVIQELERSGGRIDQQRTEERIREELGRRSNSSHPESRGEILILGMTYGLRLGKPFAAELVNIALEMLRAVPQSAWTERRRTSDGSRYRVLGGRYELLRRVISLSVALRRTDLVQSCVAFFYELLRTSDSGETASDVLCNLLPDCMRALYQMDLRSDAALLADMLIERFSPVGMGEPSTEWNALRLELAGAQLWFGLLDLATPTLNLVRDQLIAAPNWLRDQPLTFANIASAYLRVLGRGAIAETLPRILEVFEKLRAAPNTFSTSTHYSRVHLQLAEAAVLALATDDFSARADLHRRLGVSEIEARRQALTQVRERIIQWGQANW